jgi:hypothetical protein
MRSRINQIKQNFKKYLSPQERFKKQLFSPKKLYPELHRKTYLKAVLTLANNQYSCIKENAGFKEDKH